MPDPKKTKKDECNPFEKCVKNKKFNESHKRGEHKENIPGASVVKQPKYEEKFAYVVKKMASSDDDSEEDEIVKMEEHLPKHERDAKYGYYKNKR